ncbi:MAG: AraC family transcriptional regulator [Sphingobacteriales bacterium]|nr:MAG: AraC family transcriptional regulator [Sphingobacteriales bacterium]
MQHSTTNNAIDYQLVQPAPELSHFVDSFWSLSNTSSEAKPVIILPDGRIDASFSFGEARNIGLLGLESGPSRGEITAGTTMFSISFKPLAVEYLFKDYLPIVPDSAALLPANYFGVTIDEFVGMQQFCTLLSGKILAMVTEEIDERKKNLFDLIYASHGSITVKELSEKVFWSTRQINRYFQDIIGISPKAYCNILRFKSSFQHIKDGKLFPEENYSDQSHFIREIKKYAGVVPKELARNKNDRFIQFSTLPPK